jgi:hypothetical protein
MLLDVYVRLPLHGGVAGNPPETSVDEALLMFFMLLSKRTELSM